ncbi:MAG: DsrE family protein [Nitrosomonadales bacterium]|nr:DsrE family protein [Nitrosomonadales bacterium]
MKTLFILNDAPYGSERTYNGLRLAGAVTKQPDSAVRVFLIGDGASSAHRNQKVPQGFYNVEVMIGNVVRNGGEVGICGTCMDARGMGDGDIADGTHRGTLSELAEWTMWADKVLVF